MSAIRDFLQQRLDAGEWSIGQVLVRPGITLRHVADANHSGLENFTHPEDARELAKYDDAGNYRPLKTAPNLRRGWQIELSTMDELQLALDFLYPAAIGTWIAHDHGTPTIVPLRETLNRQSGMYRVTQLITDEQANGVIRKICAEGCIRRRLWGERVTIESSDILCVEACNLLVAAMRPVAKENLPKAEANS
ncbi:MAG: DR2241 family protein [Chthoniobacterales bacterium]